MSCYHPIQAYQGADGLVRFYERGGGRASVRSLQLPCGQCVGCRLERSRQWAVRCIHEAKMYDNNCFVTLTYNDDNLRDTRCRGVALRDSIPEMSLRYRDFQLFMKRLRKRRRDVRFFMCGEYGERNGRPHFHACLFNCDFSDRVLHGRSPSGSSVYRSASLEALWPHGYSTVGDLTFESAAYCARYVMKKLTGDGETCYYNVFDVTSGEIVPRAKEFAHMSLKPGIGARWFTRFCSDVYPGGMVVVNGVETRPPKYYDRLYARVDPDGMADLAMRREREGQAHFEDNSDARLAVKEQVTQARVNFLKRIL